MYQTKKVDSFQWKQQKNSSREPQKTKENLIYRP